MKWYIGNNSMHKCNYCVANICTFQPEEWLLDTEEINIKVMKIEIKTVNLFYDNSIGT